MSRGINPGDPGTGHLLDHLPATDRERELAAALIRRTQPDAAPLLAALDLEEV